MRCTKFIAIALCLLPVVAGSGCVRLGRTGSPGPGKGHGPPPHAPAHGYRAKTAEGAAIVFDSELGIYVVVGRPRRYYHDGRYYRRRHDRWEASSAGKGPWRVAPIDEIPPGLASKGKRENVEKSRLKGREPRGRKK